MSNLNRQLWSQSQSQCDKWSVSVNTVWSLVLWPWPWYGNCVVLHGQSDVIPASVAFQELLCSLVVWVCISTRASCCQRRCWSNKHVAKLPRTTYYLYILIYLQFTPQCPCFPMGTTYIAFPVDWNVWVPCSPSDTTLYPHARVQYPPGLTYQDLFLKEPKSWLHPDLYHRPRSRPVCQV